jgi:integrase
MKNVSVSPHGRRRPRSLAASILPAAVYENALRTITPFLRQRANGEGVCSAKTRKERIWFWLRMLAELWRHGYRIRKLESLSARHVEALVRDWHARGVAARSLHTRLSMMRVLCDWLGLRNVVGDLTDYLPAEAARRHTVATQSKAWEDQGIDPLKIIGQARAIDERLAVMLALQYHFGLRVKESIELRPGNAVVENGAMLELVEGTKGGKLRRVRIRTEGQRETIVWARRVVASGGNPRLRWQDCTFRQAQTRFYHLVRYRLGISRKSCGITCHGLRHGFCHEDYLGETGLPPPVKGGALGVIDRETHRMASLTVSRELGHGRVDVTTAYYGSYGHALRVTPARYDYQGLVLATDASRKP